MKKNILILFALIVLATFGAASGADAGFEAILETLTINASSSNVVTTISLPRCKMVDVYFYCPTLDSGSTATLAMTSLLFEDFSAATGVITPNGWTDKAIGATDDGAIIKVLSAVTSIYLNGSVVFTFTAADAQDADRVAYLWILREF